MAETQKPPVCDVRIASKGPRFFRADDGGVMFEIQLDSRCKIGPRPAIDEDRRQYPIAWRAFATGEQAAAEPLQSRVAAVDHPQAKSAHDQDKTQRQAAMDARRRGGL